MIYLDSDTLDECRDAILYGRSIQEIADCLGADSRALAQLLAVEYPGGDAVVTSDAQIDIGACDRLYSVL